MSSPFELTTADLIAPDVTDGPPMTVEERRQAIERTIRQYPLWSDRRIAAATGLAARLVADVRRGVGPATTARIGRDRRVRPVDPAAGRMRAADLLREDPNQPLRQVARLAGVSPETVRAVRTALRAADAPDTPPPAGHGDPAAGPRPGSGFAALPSMRTDPSLRFTDRGRTLLRLFDLHALSITDWATLADGVPTHRAESVADLARSCALMWGELAHRLDTRRTA